GHFPANPPAIIVASDSLGKQDGRLMSGPVIEHPGLQIRVRHSSYLAAYGRIAAVQKLFDLTRNKVIPSADGSYLLESVSRVGGIAYLGRLDGTGLEQMSANFNLSIRKLS